jgi:hypothetical protein
MFYHFFLLSLKARIALLLIAKLIIFLTCQLNRASKGFEGALQKRAHNISFLIFSGITGRSIFTV